MISGRTYVAESIIEAIEKYLVEQKDIALVKYVVEMDEFGTFETNKNE
jgi:nucleoid DNA-binding protein